MNRRSNKLRTLAGSALLATTSALAIAIAYSGSAQAGSTNAPLPITNTGTTDFIEYSFFGSPSPSNGDITNTGTINTTTVGHTRAIAINNSNLGAPNNPPPANRPGAPTNIVNQGTINSSKTGVAIAFSNFWGTINNSGSLTATAGNGIMLNDVNAFPPIPGFSPGVLTSITNSGTITAHGSGSPFDAIFGAAPIGNGIAVIGGTTVAGTIGNSGKIIADQAGILVTGTPLGFGTGSTVTGSVGNTGSINASIGIAITSGGVVQGGVSNGATATITTSGPAILVQSATVTGGITNGGTLASSGAQTPFFPSGALAVLGGTVNGDITNNKLITSNSNGIAVACLNGGFGCFTGSTVNGNVVNSATGTITVTGLVGSGVNVDGINMNASTVNGMISNAGTISSSQGNGIGVVGIFASVTKGIANSGTIIAGTAAHGLQGSGISVSGTLATISGTGGAPAILNSGTINAAGNGINLGSFVTANGDLVNTGGITATTAATAGTASTTGGVGINIGSLSTVSGSVTNGAAGTLIATTGVANAGSITGAINNSGTLIGFTAAINTTADIIATTINQSGGIMEGSVLLSSSKSDRLNVSGGIQFGQITGGSSTKLTISSTGTVVLLESFNDTLGSFSQTGGNFNVFVDAPAANGSTTGKSGTVALGSGPVVLSSNGIFEITEIGNPATYNNHQTYVDVLQTGGSVTGSLPTSVSDSPYFVASTTRDLGGVSVNLDRLSFSGFAGLTRNESQAGLGLDGFFNGPRGGDALALLGAIMSLNPGTQLGNALDQLAGEQHPQSNHVALTVTETTIRLIQDRLGALGTGFVAGGSMASLSNNGLRYQVAALDTIYDDGTSVAQAGGSMDLGQVALWIRGFGRFADSSSTTFAPGFNATSGGVILGVDTQVSDNMLAGIAASYAYTSVSFNQGAGSTDLDSFLVAPYGRIGSGNWYASGVLGIGFDNFNTSRHIAFPGFAATASSSHSGLAVGGSFETGYTFRPGSFTLTPVVGFDVSHISTDSFTESGAGAADLAVKSANSDSAAASIGVRVATRIDNAEGGSFTPEAHVIYRHDFLADQQQVGETFVQVPSGGTFTVVSSRFGKDALLAGIGVNYDLSPTSKLFANYDGEFSSGFTSHTVSAGYRMKF